jgi:hypothetical protein
VLKGVSSGVRSLRPWASASIIAIAGSCMGGCGKRGEVDSCWKEHYSGDCGDYEHVPDPISKLRFSTSTKHEGSVALEPVNANSCCSQILNHWLDSEPLEFRLIVGSSGSVSRDWVSSL